MDYEVDSAFNEAEGRWDVAVRGEIDIFSSNDFREKLTGLIGKRETGLRLDCAGLVYIDSTGLGALVSVLKAVREFGGEIRLANLTHTVSKLFRITNLDKAFVIEGDVIE